MLNPFNLLKKVPARPESFVVIDPGTICAKAFVFSLDGEPRLLGRGRGTTVEEAVSQTGFAGKNAVAALSGAAAWCLTTTIRHHRLASSKPIGEEEVKNLSEKIFQAAEVQAAQQRGMFFGDFGWEPQLVDSYPLTYRIDGQPVSEPQGQTGRILEGSFFTAHAPAAFLEKLTAELKSLGLNLWAVTSLPSLIVKHLAGENPREFNAIVLDVGGQLTEVGVVIGGGVWGSRPLFLGGDLFTEVCGSEEKKIAYAQSRLGNEETFKLRQELKLALDLWHSGVEAALADFEGVKAFPEKIVLTGGGAKLPDLEESLSSYPLRKTLPFAAIPMVEAITFDAEPFSLLAKEVLGGDNAG
jgi:cell division ATPase FtsA